MHREGGGCPGPLRCGVPELGTNCHGTQVLSLGDQSKEPSGAGGRFWKTLLFPCHHVVGATRSPG